MAKYYLQKQNQLKNVDGERYWPRFVGGNVRTTADMLKDMEMMHMGRPAEIQAALINISDYIAQQMREGNTVQLDGIGNFVPALGMNDCIKVTRRGNSGDYFMVDGLHIKDVRFTVDKELLREANKGFKATRTTKPKAAANSKDLQDESARADAVRDYIRKNGYIGISDYVGLSGLSYSKAVSELKHWAALPYGFLEARGKASHKVYVLRQA